MLKIGDFSKLAQVSIKTLRYYGELGLLKPAWIDRFTGYRYYSLDQLPRLNRILALKDLGFSLEQIRPLLREDLPAAELRGMMRLKHAELERKLRTEQARLVRVETRLSQIEREGSLPAYDVVLKSVPPQRVIGIRDTLPSYSEVGRLFEELQAYLRAREVDLDLAYPGIAIYYDAEYREQGIDAEVAMPSPRSLRGAGRAVVHDLPGAAAMACAVHYGDDAGLADAYKALMGWIEANGYRVNGPNRDVYLQRPGRGRGVSDCVIEVQFPVERKPIPTFITGLKEKSQMEVKIVTKPAFTAVGMKYQGNHQNSNTFSEIGQMWGEFEPRIGEIKHGTGEHVTYGVCRELGAEETFEYLAAVEVDKAEGIPVGMESWEVPEQTYAVFPCTLKTIGETYQYAMHTWMPQSGYEWAEGPDFECYDERSDPEAEDLELTIYVPVKKRG